MYNNISRHTLIAFTLAEVLITLIVIGMIAALTLPAMITNLQDRQNRTAWRETYSILDQATKRIIIDNGGTLEGVFTRDGATWSKHFKDKYAEYLNYSRSCTDTSRGNCWSDTYKLLNGTECDFFGAVPIGYGAGTGSYDSSGLVLTNGVFLVFKDPGAYVQSCEYSPSFDYERRVCGSIYADVNGFKEPNTVGKDIFLVHVTRSGIKPWGYMTMDDYPSIGRCIQPPETNWNAGSNPGYGCSLRYLQQ